MATIKLKFRASSIRGNKGTLYYQVTHRRIVKYISTGYHVYADEWDRDKSALVIRSDSSRKAELTLLQSVLAWELSQREEIIRNFEACNSDITIGEMCGGFNRIKKQKTVFTYLQEQASRQKRMYRLGTAKTYTNAYLRFREFRKCCDLAFAQLTPDMIEEYEAWLTNRGLKINTIRFYLRTLNTLFRKAVGDGLIDDDGRLFCRVRLSYVKTKKRAVSVREIRAIRQLHLPEGGILAFARDIFMFSFYMRGMPFVDIAFLKKTNLKNGVLSYCRKKTNQYLTVAWEREQQVIVGRYAHITQGSPYMLPIIKKSDGTEYKQYQRMQENVNRALKKIGVMMGLKIPLTTYVARHSWASIARDMNIPISVISEGMGHQSYNTTQVYLDTIDTSKINEANRNIMRRIKVEKIG